MWFYRKRIETKRLPVSERGSQGVTHRQELLAGFDQASLERASVVLLGAGGIGSEIGEGLVRKGIKELRVFDHDAVDLTNLNRQMFFKKDLYKNKALRLVRNLAPHATCGTILEGYAWSFQDALAKQLEMRASVCVVGVDNGKTRVEASTFYRKLGIPIVFIAVDLMAEAGYVFVQEPGSACFGCVFPKTMYGAKAPCWTPAAKDILKTMAGIALYAIDTLLMDRKRNWNYRHVHLAGFAPSDERMIERRADCPLCGSSTGIHQ